jgi:hypothetical protein
MRSRSTPEQPECFIRRHALIVHVQSLLQQGKAVSLYGPLGVGKSALARACILGSAHARWTLVNCEVLPRTQAPVSTGANTLFDNADRALRIVAERVSEIRRASPVAQVIITSCEPLLHPDVARVEVAPLSTAPGAEASQLFFEAYAASKSKRVITAELAATIVQATQGMPETIVAAALRAAEGETDLVPWIERGDYLCGPRWHGARSLDERVRQCWQDLSEAEQRLLLLLAQWQAPVSASLLLSLSGQELAAADRLATRSLLTRNEDRSRVLPSSHMRAHARALTVSSLSVRTALHGITTSVAALDEYWVLDLDAARCPHERGDDAWALVPIALEAKDASAAVSLAFHASRHYSLKGPLDVYDTRLSELMRKVPEALLGHLHLVRGCARLFAGVFEDAAADFAVAARCPERMIRVQALRKLGLVHGLQGRTKEAFAS